MAIQSEAALENGLIATLRKSYLENLDKHWYSISSKLV